MQIAKSSVPSLLPDFVFFCRASIIIHAMREDGRIIHLWSLWRMMNFRCFTEIQELRRLLHFSTPWPRPTAQMGKTCHVLRFLTWSPTQLRMRPWLDPQSTLKIGRIWEFDDSQLLWLFCVMVMQNIFQHMVIHSGNPPKTGYNLIYQNYGDSHYGWPCDIMRYTISTPYNGILITIIIYVIRWTILMMLIGPWVSVRTSPWFCQTIPWGRSGDGASRLHHHFRWNPCIFI